VSDDYAILPSHVQGSKFSESNSLWLVLVPFSFIQRVEDMVVATEINAVLDICIKGTKAANAVLKYVRELRDAPARVKDTAYELEVSTLVCSRLQGRTNLLKRMVSMVSFLGQISFESMTLARGRRLISAVSENTSRNSMIYPTRRTIASRRSSKMKPRYLPAT
jgi:hypothetical protein